EDVAPSPPVVDVAAEPPPPLLEPQERLAEAPPAVDLSAEPPPPPLPEPQERLAEAPPAVDLSAEPPPPPPPLPEVVQAAPPAPLATEPLLVTEQRGGTLCLYWELPPEVVARSGLTESEGEPAVVVVAFTPSGPQPRRDQRTLLLDWRSPFAGCPTVDDLGASAAVRAAVGWVVEGTFLPLAVGRTLERSEKDASDSAERARAALGQLPI